MEFGLNWTTRGYANSRIRQDVDCTTRGFVDATGSSRPIPVVLIA